MIKKTYQIKYINIPDGQYIYAVVYRQNRKLYLNQSFAGKTKLYIVK